MLSYRQIKNQFKKRQLETNGKKNMMVKRFKSVEIPRRSELLAKITNFNHLPNEIYREIFDYLCPLNVIYSFDELNHRFKRLIEDIPMKLNFQNLNKNQYKRILKQIVPRITQQIVVIELGQTSAFSPSFNSEFLIDLFIQSFHLTQFVNLRSLSLTSPNFKQLESLFLVIPNLLSLRSLRLLEQDYCGSQNETVCKLELANNRHSSMNKTNQLTHLFIETSPPFKSLTLLYQHLINKISLDYFQINIRCALFFYPHCLTHIDYNGLSRLITKMNYLKVDVICGTYSPAFDLIQRFPQIEYLSVKTVLKAYANGYQWADLLVQLPNLIKLDLSIQLESCKSDQELPTFQSQFWFDRQWFIQCRKNPLNSLECQFRHRNIQVR